jgi:hypothetical protein
MKLSLAQAEVASENKRCLLFSQIYELVHDNDVHQESKIGETRSKHRTRNKYIQWYWHNIYSEKMEFFLENQAEYWVYTNVCKGHVKK